MNAQERTQHYLSQLIGSYRLVDYSFTPTGSNKVVVIAPSSPSRVLFYCDCSATAQVKPCFRGTGDNLIILPLAGTPITYFVNVQQHYILPSQEIVFLDNAFGLLVPAYGIVLE